MTFVFSTISPFVEPALTSVTSDHAYSYNEFTRSDRTNFPHTNAYMGIQLCFFAPLWRGTFTLAFVSKSPSKNSNIKIKADFLLKVFISLLEQDLIFQRRSFTGLDWLSGDDKEIVPQIV